MDNNTEQLEEIKDDLQRVLNLLSHVSDQLPEFYSNEIISNLENKFSSLFILVDQVNKVLKQSNSCMNEMRGKLRVYELEIKRLKNDRKNCTP